MGEFEATMDKKFRLTTKKFIEQMEMLDLLNWESEYSDPGISMEHNGR